jgi:hypothetical protein
MEDSYCDRDSSSSNSDNEEKECKVSDFVFWSLSLIATQSETQDWLQTVHKGAFAHLSSDFENYNGYSLNNMTRYEFLKKTSDPEKQRQFLLLFETLHPSFSLRFNLTNNQIRNKCIYDLSEAEINILLSDKSLPESTRKQCQQLRSILLLNSRDHSKLLRNTYFKEEFQSLIDQNEDEIDSHLDLTIKLS